MNELVNISMKTFWNIFKKSIKLPKKQAAFGLNRIGMDMIILYMFLLLALTSVPGLIEQIQSNMDNTDIQIKTFFWLIFFFMFYYLTMISIIFVCISIIAYVGSWVAQATSRKLRYSILWKMAACITTIPLLIFTIMSLFYTVGYGYLALAFVFHIVVFIQTIILYPKRRHLYKNK